ncbi:hypothetical protein [Vitiosangium sp. GDMCC 1.1324]|uniref:hypothetical protein n=1 Tax=Vitiosangium sp. (strain GDMCC 1.1324) TaxID=2138576 RepID=UPI000D33FE8E|nr:hypothetical protein [Vitiosangium sp. GDMCC 1.1324]PTL83216.1 hypothetical protein DAT35_14560 [Vitiosangium sp. GDMCC 1.1324]
MDVTGRASYQSWLESFASARDVLAGTVHLRRGDALELVATLNIPPPVMNAVRVISNGKGLTGIAFATREPVQPHDLQVNGGSAWVMHVHAAVALPVLDAAGEVRAVVGITFLREGVLSAELTHRLMAAAAALPADVS